MTIRKVATRTRRHERLRRKLAGSSERPRLSVYRSNRHIYAQVIDDLQGVTLASASTLEAEAAGASKSEAAKKVGSLVAERAKASGVSAVVFDRGGFQYHGRIAQVAEGAREAGLTL